MKGREQIRRWAVRLASRWDDMQLANQGSSGLIGELEHRLVTGMLSRWPESIDHQAAAEIARDIAEEVGTKALENLL